MDRIERSLGCGFAATRSRPTTAEADVRSHRTISRLRLRNDEEPLRIAPDPKRGGARPNENAPDRRAEKHPVLLQPGEVRAVEIDTRAWRRRGV
jgi:hypothetical protein